MANLSLVLFLILVFRLIDRYQTYWSVIEVWNSTVRHDLERTIFTFETVFKREYWHDQDNKRIFSHITCLPFAMKAVLRENRDIAEVEGVLTLADYEALWAPPHFSTDIFKVLATYLTSEDTRDPDTLESGDNALEFLQFGFSPLPSNMGATLTRRKLNCFIGLPPSLFVNFCVLNSSWPVPFL